MTDTNQTGAGNQGDLVSLTDVPAPAGSGESGVQSQDSILNAAHEFEVQLEQMSAWKHQLAQQMEVMRRDGIKLLERQKSLAIEKKKLAEEREALVADRQQIEALHRVLGEGTKAMRAKEEELGRARGELQKLESERARWEQDIQAAQAATRELEQKRSQMAEAIAASESRLQEIQGILNQGDEARQEIAAAREALAAIEAQRNAAEGAVHQLSLKEAELQAREKSLAEQEARHLERDVQLRSALEQLEEQRRELAEAQRAVMHERQSLEQQQRDLAQQKLGVESELQAQVDAAENSKKLMEEERNALLKQRRELEKKLDEMEGELASQLEALAKQTRRMTERRAELETRSEELEKEFQQRLSRETEAMREELSRKERTYEQRAALLQQEIDQALAQVSDVQEREGSLRAQLTAAGEQIGAGQRELTRLTAELSEVNRDRTEQARLLQEQVTRYEQDVAEWQRRLDAAAARNETTEGASAAELQAARQAAERAGAELEETRTRLAQLEAQQREWEQKGSAPAESAAQVAELMQQIEMLEKQRNDLAEQVLTVQDTMRRQSEDALLARNVIESELIDLRRRHAALEAERTTWQPPPARQSGGDETLPTNGTSDGANLIAHHDRLLRQAKTLRAYRKQSRESIAALEKSRAEIAQQREQLRTRKENLEQVKRLLEKQEMVMARKLADHNALKTVAAVGIFVIMVLGSTFLGVYKFATPTYRSEAVVQLAPPQEISGNALQAWLSHQMEFLRSEDVTFTAWKILRSPDQHYAMHDVREEWLSSLAKNLTMQVDPTTRTLAIHYAGPSAEGVSQVCNALATAYITPAAREGSKPEDKSVGLGATIAAPATISEFPAQDNRMMISLSVVAIVLFVSLLLVIVFRHYVARQLREIDQMADEEDLDDIQGEMPAEANPA